MGKRYIVEENKNKKLKWFVFIACAVVIVVVALVLTINMISGDTHDSLSDYKFPDAEEYTWEQYELLTPEEKMVFPDFFNSMEEYNAWYESVKPKDDGDSIAPTINLNGKEPTGFTWEEYQNLTPEEQMLFPDYFDSMEEYNNWYKSVKPKDDDNNTVPTINLNGKEPTDFTWEEYQSLTIDERAIFPDYFESFGEYQRWYESVCVEN